MSTMLTVDLDWTLFSALFSGNFGQNSVVVLLLLFFAETLSQSQGSHGYELASPAVSLDCIKTHVFDGVSKVGCAIFASRMSLYNFGFVLLNETCMICRAGGTPRDPTVMETTIKGTLHVYGKAFVRNAHIYSIFKLFQGSMYHQNFTSPVYQHL